MMLFFSLLMLFSGIVWGGYLFWRDTRGGDRLPEKRSRYQVVALNPTTQQWLKDHLTGNPIDDIRAIRAQFGLSTEEAEKLLRRNAHLLKR